MEALKKVLEPIDINSLISCMETLGYIGPQDVEINDIDSFFSKSSKSNNDKTNKIREHIILLILNRKIPELWFKTSKQWDQVRNELEQFIYNLKPGVPLKSVKQLAGRKYNYDFLFTFENGETVKIEFKFNVKSIDKYPEILSVTSNNFTKGVIYPDYFYDNYVQKLQREDTLTKEIYLKTIHKNKSNIPFFINLKQDNVLKAETNKSIKEYLQQLDFDFDNFKEKIKLQLDKVFMLWYNGTFYMDILHEHDVDVIEPVKIKNDNTIVVTTRNGATEYHLLLRWKNGNGILLPAWQVKIVRPKI